mmetsp:Transcript_36225/g.89267  ORF Transcript_36225/g.89267 Transcript_36225/m.89267 type:complete len:194 (-) Transcript_36225:20-601(-)
MATKRVSSAKSDLGGERPYVRDGVSPLVAQLINLAHVRTERARPPPSETSASSHMTAISTLHPDTASRDMFQSFEAFSALAATRGGRDGGGSDDGGGGGRDGGGGGDSGGGDNDFDTNDPVSRLQGIVCLRRAACAALLSRAGGDVAAAVNNHYAAHDTDRIGVIGAPQAPQPSTSVGATAPTAAGRGGGGAA